MSSMIGDDWNMLFDCKAIAIVDSSHINYIQVHRRNTHKIC